MGTVAFINAVYCTGYAFEPVYGGKSAVQSALEYAETLPNIEKIIILSTEGGKERFPRGVEDDVVIRETWTFQDVLDEMLRRAGEADHLYYFYADCPLLSPALTEGLYRTHTTYYADYTFADGYPYGMTPEILKREMLQAVRKLAGDDPLPVERNSLFTVIQRDINAFDIETELAEKDMRMLRVSLTCDTGRNYLQVKRLMETAGNAGEAAGVGGEDILRAVEKNPEYLRTLPAFIDFQISARCPQACPYCPYPEVRKDLLETEEEMDLEDFSGMIGKIADFSGDAVIGIGYLGDPGTHSRVEDFVERVLRYPNLDLLIVTSGVGWRAESLERINAAAKSLPGGVERMTWIVSLDGWSERVYREHRGEGFAEALRFVKGLGEIFPRTTYVQAVRMKSNEADLEDFYRNWKRELGNVIIQKYDSFSGFLPDRTVTDLSPVKRFPCWHIKRDLVVRLDGTVPQCKEDVQISRVLGNLIRDPLEKIWDRGGDIYGEHLRGDYSPMCEGCDEYYTYYY